MAFDDAKPITRRECDRCPLHTEVNIMKEWQTKWDGRFWAGLALAVTNLLGIVTTLIILLSQKGPAMAGVVK